MSDPSLIHNTQAEQHSIKPTNVDPVMPSYPWLHHYDAGVPRQLDIPERSLTSILDNAAKNYPHQTAFIYYGNRISYAQFSNLANRFAIELQRLGVQKGDRVAIALPNIPQFPIAFFGTLRVGAVAVPTNPLYTEREMQHQLADSGAKVLVVLDRFYPIVRNIRQQTSLEQIIVTSPADFLPPLLQKLYPLSLRGTKQPQLPLTKREVAQDPGLHFMQPFLKSRTKGGIELFHLPVHIQGNDLAILQYTGGTTGLSKGAMLTHRNVLANAMQTRYWVPRVKDGTEITLCVTPLFHAYGLTVGMNLSILAAATMVLLPQFKAKDVLEAVHRYHPSMFPGIPTMYVAIMREAEKHPEYLKSVKYCISGASPLAAKIQADFEKITSGKLVEGYGLSEAAPVTHCNPLSDQCRNGSIGLPVPDVEAAIINSITGTSLPAGEVGEIVVKGPNIMQGYWQRTTETQEMFINGWMRTGDIGKMDEDGFFYVVERAKDMIIASGFNVYPREIEEVLFQHPAIAEAAVAGVPDSYRGETVAAFIVLKEGFTPSEKLEQEIVLFCKQQLAAYKVPKRLEFRDQLPKSIIGKVLRRELRKQT
ncbi:long-chain-fatty-acid--CoA ligase [Dictyobacter arantiisoli]|uniref:Long-chain-fatty-acid--CoA ligase n=1 Tax=Dictyobacter arantiisoli TaxID=2014874 RepID=A0A5A5T593_9CHLR|nr:long-chain fatty acid--CoA ligase [Dictyobacter arantiisoli]GCF06438.1 long-chain-fatty-acid--CoA ligase [Dictyobacter arantiisoli]